MNESLMQMATAAAGPCSSGFRVRASFRAPPPFLPLRLHGDFYRLPASLTLPPLRLHLRGYSLSTFARRRKNTPAAPAPPTKKETLQFDGGDDDDELDEDAFEALFSQLEEDLKNDNLSGNDSDNEITEEDIEKLEKELEEALGDDYDDDFLRISSSSSENMESHGEEEEEDEEQKLPKIKNWQLRRLATALKIGRRKTNIKNLAAELGLDRAVVLELLREPPPNLLLMSASLPDKVEVTAVEAESQPSEFYSFPTLTTPEMELKAKTPIHVMQSNWSAQKRLKKVQVETLERVYQRTKRPTNAMINSIIHVTNLPWKKVVKWFEEKRVQDGVPEKRLPFHRAAPNRR